MSTDEQVIDPLDTDINETIRFKYDITSFGADFPVDGLVSRLVSEDIFIPSFQRQYVWSKTQASRFIESLLLGLPVPGIFLYQEHNKKMMVIDGQQRLRTLQFFYKGIFKPKEFGGRGEEFVLSNVKDDLEGLKYDTLSEDDKRLLDFTIIHATIIRQDRPSNDQGSIYYIFERLNTGGTNLIAQEIRVCIYHGLFINLLEKLNEYKPWREIFGKKNKRLKDQEFILRFFALYFRMNKYERPMVQFLNSFMELNQDLSKVPDEILTRLFKSTIDVVYDAIGTNAFRPERKLNAAVFESVMVGISKSMNGASSINKQELKKEYDKLMTNQDYLNACTSGTAEESSVETRLNLAIEAFARINDN